ncbi:uncharacterized protein PAC_01710 [Phialocephala subalpina]|uniref:Uncharacterized protein n=1 Tax=Phialocephala subalpina TaxID=576137 RepID=A0A1L7WGF7_9HELO|nr:uncharacterized protein PAC_01710 [Phialocephala subalpina]
MRTMTGKEDRYLFSWFIITARFLELLLPLLCMSIWTTGQLGAARRLLWSEGASRAFNSDPSVGRYFYANQTETSNVPFIWSARSTESNIAVVMCTSMIVVARGGMHASSKVNVRLMDLVFNVVLLPLWIGSLIGQLSSDDSDPHHSSLYPWYLRSSCASAHLGAQRACRNAQLTFLLTFLMILLYGAWTLKNLYHEARKFFGGDNQNSVQKRELFLEA